MSLHKSVLAFVAAAACIHAAATPFAVIPRSGNEIGIVDIALNQNVATVAASDIRGIALLPAGNFFYVSSSGSNSVQVIDAATYQQVASIPVTNPRGLALNPAGTRLYVTSRSANQLVVIDTATNAVIGSVAVGSQPSFVAISPSGDRAYVNATGTAISVVDTATNTVMGTITVGTNPFGIAFSPDGTRAYVANYATDNVSVIDTATATIAATWSPCGGPVFLDVDPTGATLYVSCESGAGRAVDTATGTAGATAPPFPAGRGFALQVHPADASVYFAGQSNLHVVTPSLLSIVQTVPAPFLGSSISLHRFISTRPDDTTPGAYSFAAQTATATSTVIASAASLVTNINTGTNVTVSGAGEYCVSTTTACSCNVAAFGTAAGTILPNQYVCLRHTSSAVPLTQTDTTVTVGGVAATFSSTTAVVAPDAPTIDGVTPGNAQATVAFTPPAFTGGSAITSFMATCGAQSASGAGSPLVVGGLANGVAVNCSVTATSAGGTSVPSGIVSVTPRTVPDAPVIGVVAPGNTQASVAFAAPAFDGGSAITNYTATCGAQNAAGAASPIVVSGLVNGVAVNCSVTATNIAGTSLPSGTAPVTPRTVPDAPTIGVVTPGNAQASVAFTPPASDGGSAITGYTATCGAQGASGAASPLVVTGLANGVAVNCSVTATSAAGTSLPSGVAPVTPRTVPGAPTIGAVAPGNGQATVAFTPPASDGGAPITSFTATCGAQSASGPASPLTVTGLANSTAVNCSVTATNVAGTGPASGVASVTPSLNTYSAPSATGTGTITASFTGGGAGCSFVAPAFIAAPPGATPVPPTAPSNVAFPHGLFDFRLGGCTPGATVNFTIVYPAALPATTQYWKYGPTPGNATPHWYTLPSTVAGSTVTFTLTDGGLGDDDVVANGTIVDQGGPGVPGAPGTATAVPTLSEWMLMLLATLMLFTVVLRERRSS